MVMRMLKHCALALAFALSVFEPLVERVVAFAVRTVERCEDARGQMVKLKAELAQSFRTRSSEAGRADGMLKESNGFRLTGILQTFGALPLKVGWQSS